jgi:hypothetical protein
MDDSMEKALRQMAEELKDNPAQDKLKLIEKVSRDCNLTPVQTEFLTDKYLLNA